MGVHSLEDLYESCMYSMIVNLKLRSSLLTSQ